MNRVLLGVYLLAFFGAVANSQAGVLCENILHRIQDIRLRSPSRSEGFYSHLFPLTSLRFFRGTEGWKESQREQNDLGDGFRNWESSRMTSPEADDSYSPKIFLPQNKRHFYEFYQQGFKALRYSKKIRMISTGLEISVVTNITGEKFLVFERPAFMIEYVKVPRFYKSFNVEDPLAESFLESRRPETWKPQVDLLDLTYRVIRRELLPHIKISFDRGIQEYLSDYFPGAQRYYQNSVTKLGRSGAISLLYGYRLPGDEQRGDPPVEVLGHFSLLTGRYVVNYEKPPIVPEYSTEARSSQD